MFIPDHGSEVFHPGNPIQGQKDFRSWIPGSASKNLDNDKFKQWGGGTDRGSISFNARLVNLGSSRTIPVPFFIF